MVQIVLRPRYLSFLEERLASIRDDLYAFLKKLEKLEDSDWRGIENEFTFHKGLKEHLLSPFTASREEKMQYISNKLNRIFEPKLGRFTSLVELRFPWIKKISIQHEVATYHYLTRRLYINPSMARFVKFINDFDYEELDKPANIILSAIFSYGKSFIEENFTRLNPDILRVALEKGISRGWIRIEEPNRIIVAQEPILCGKCPRCRSDVSFAKRFCPHCGYDTWNLVMKSLEPKNQVDQYITGEGQYVIKIKFYVSAGKLQWANPLYDEDKDYFPSVDMFITDVEGRSIKAEVNLFELIDGVLKSGLVQKDWCEDQYYSENYAEFFKLDENYKECICLKLCGKSLEEVQIKLKEMLNLIHKQIKQTVKQAYIDALKLYELSRYWSTSLMSARLSMALSQKEEKMLKEKLKIIKRKKMEEVYHKCLSEEEAVEILFNETMNSFSPRLDVLLKIIQSHAISLERPKRLHNNLEKYVERVSITFSIDHDVPEGIILEDLSEITDKTIINILKKWYGYIDKVILVYELGLSLEEADKVLRKFEKQGLIVRRTDLLPGGELYTSPVVRELLSPVYQKILETIEREGGEIHRANLVQKLSDIPIEILQDHLEILRSKGIIIYDDVADTYYLRSFGI